MSGSVHALLKFTKPKLGFDPEFSGAEFARWQKRVRAKLRELMAFPKTHAQPSPRKLWIGRSYLGWSAFQAWNLYRWASVLPWVDPKRIGVSGHSLGSEAATVLAVIEPRIRALVFNSNLQSRQKRAVATGLVPMPAWHYTPRLLEWFDFPDLIAAMAPRPVLVAEGGLVSDIRRVRQAFRLAGAAANFKVLHFPRYATPARRKTDRQKLPEGLSMDEFKQWTALDSSRHYFKHKVAVPWLARAFRSRSS